MNISSLDKNFKLTDSIDESDIIWLKADEFPALRNHKKGTP